MKGVELAREPCLTPTVPPPDQDARWVYSSSGNPPQQGSASPGAQWQGQGPTVTLSRFVLAQSHPNAEAGEIKVDVVPVPPERADGDIGGGAGGSRAESIKKIGEGADASAAVGMYPTERQAPSRAYLRRGERNLRRCSSLGVSRSRTTRISQNLLSTRGSEGRGGGYGQSLQTPWSPPLAAKERKAGAGFGFSSSGGIDLGVAGGLMSPNSSSVSPWCRQSASPTEWGSPAGGKFEGQGRGVVGWADDASGSNA